jgi:hypothetical protein
MKMKKLVLTFTMSLVVYVCFAQISSIVLLSEKAYDDNTKTVYFRLGGQLYPEMIEAIETNITQNPDIVSIKFYDQENRMNCMATISSEISLMQINEAINDVLAEHQLYNVTEDYPETYYTWEDKTVKFTVAESEGFINFQNSLDYINLQEGVIAAEIKNGGVCKITIIKTLSKSDIEQMFKDAGLEIIPNAQN